MRIPILVALTCLIVASAVAAEPIDPRIKEFFDRDEPIVVLVVDRTYEGGSISKACVPQPGAIYAPIESGLTRMNLKSGSERGLWMLIITLMGGYTTAAGLPPDQCDMTVEVTFWERSPVFDGKKATDIDEIDTKKFSLPGIPFYLEHYQITRAQPYAQAGVEETVSRAVDEFATELLKAIEK